MGKRFEVILTLCLLCSGLLYANPVDMEEARQKAAQFLTRQTSKTDGRRMTPTRMPRMKLAHERTTTDGQPAFYIFNNDAGGFVIVSGDDQAEEILGFSDSGQFDTNKIPDGLADLLAEYEEQINHVITQSQSRAAKRANSQWAEIAPLVQTHWNQYEPFNTLCPIDPDDGERCITGCVATAVAQLLYYHKWPEIGYGSSSYSWRGQTLTTDFTQARFEYDKMKLKYNDDNDEDNAVATLMYYCAMAAQADFTSSSTGGWVSTGDFRRLFGYKEAKWLDLSSTTLNNFESIIYNELQQKRPVLFSSNDPERDGHLMIIDGYQSDGFFHINLGWGGDKDGYYKLTAVDTDWYNFTTDQDIIYNLEPDYNAPLEANVYPRKSYQLSDDGKTLVKWVGDESFIHLGADAALWGVTEIGEKAFEDCTSLEAIFIPSQITYIRRNAFAGCTNLQSINVDANNTQYHESDGLLIDNYNTVIASTAVNSLIIPEAVSELYYGAFTNCTELKQITMLSKNPIYPYNNCFNADMDYSSVTLYVPKQSVSQYRNHYFWGKFKNIVGASAPTSKKLIVETITGQKREFMLYQMPVMKNNGMTLELTTQLGQTVSYDLSKLQKMTFKDTPQLGDPNGRGGVNVADVTALVSHLKGKTPTGFDRLAADVNQDGRVDGNDVGALAALVIGRREALARQDGQTAALGTEPAGETPDDAAMYIYLNDGSRLKAFLMNQVAHVSYSNTGLDGIVYDIPAVQLVQTRDSLYRIPIAAIDSICYQTPEPIMKKGLFIIDEKNVGSIASVDFDNYTITFKSGTASLPKQEQIIYSDLEQDPLPMGFSGRVTKISGNVYTWESAGPEEVYDRLLVVGHIEPGGTHSSSSRRLLPRRGHAEPTYNINTSIGDFVTISGNGQLILDYTFNVNAFNSEPAMFDMTMKHELTTELKVGYNASNVSGAFNSPYEPDEKVKEIWGWPVELLSAGPIHIDVNSGVYFSYGGEFSVELSGLKYKHTDIRKYSWRADNPFHIEHKKVYSDGGWCDLYDNAKLKAEIAAKVSFGVCAELAFVLWKANWMSLPLKFRCGPELKGSISLDTDLLKSDSYATAMYKEFSENVKFTLGVKLGVDLQAQYKKKTWTIASASTTLLPKTVTLLPKLSKPALPLIMRIGPDKFYTETSYGWDHVNPMSVKTKASNITLFPGPIGLAVYDAKGKELFNKFAEGFDNWHWVEASTFQASIGQYSGQTVKVYPQYKLLGIIPLKGEPSEITVPKQMTLSASTATVQEDQSIQIDINDGWGYYSMDAADEAIAIPSYRKRADGTHCLNIMGYKAGATTITVKDVRSGITKTVSVSVKPTPIKLSATNIKMRLGETKNVTVSPKAIYTVECSDPEVASVIIDPNNASGTALHLISFQITALKAGKATITITDPVRCRTATIQVEVKSLDGVTDAAEAKDLGLPSGMLWASWNIGASAPEEAGGYYAWGETLEKTNYSWSNYLHCDGSEETIHDIDENIGFTEYDVANKQWGGLWRLPTYEDFVELNKNCTKQWEQLNGQWGMRFTGPNGNSIFLPASGYFDGRTLNEDSSQGYYWTGVLSTGNPVYFNLYDTSTDCYGGSNRFRGYTIRPVQGAKSGDYVPGICSNYFPQDEVVLKGTSLNIGCLITMPWNGVFVGTIIISDKPDMSHKVKKVNISGTGTYGNTYSWFSTSFWDLKPVTKYYWQVSYFDFETDTYRRCSPIWSFTTGPE